MLENALHSSWHGAALPPGYTLQQGSIFFRDEEGAHTRIAGAPAVVPSLSRSLDNEGWSATIVFADRDGGIHDLRVKAADLALSPVTVVRRMLDGGFPSAGLKVKSFCAYLREFEPQVRQRVVHRGGWIEGEGLLVFVFPCGRVLGPTDGEEVLFDGHR